MLAPVGFDPRATSWKSPLTCWPHGYAYEYNSLFDPFYVDGSETPCQVARQPFGRSQSPTPTQTAYAYTDCAIDQGYRAVQELRRFSVALTSAWGSLCTFVSSVSPWFMLSADTDFRVFPGRFPMPKRSMIRNAPRNNSRKPTVPFAHGYGSLGERRQGCFSGLGSPKR